MDYNTGPTKFNTFRQIEFMTDKAIIKKIQIAHKILGEVVEHFNKQEAGVKKQRYSAMREIKERADSGKRGKPLELKKDPSKAY